MSVRPGFTAPVDAQSSDEIVAAPESEKSPKWHAFGLTRRTGRAASAPREGARRVLALRCS